MEENQLEQYYKQIEKRLNFAKNKKQLIRFFKEQVDSYINDNPNTTLQELYEQFGTPVEVVNRWIARTPKALNMIQKRKIVKIIIAAILAFICLFFLTIGIGLIHGWTSGSLDNPFTGETVGYAPVYEATTYIAN